MTAKASSGAFRALRFAGLVALSGLGVAIFLVSGSYLFWQSETNSEVVSQRNLQELRNRLERSNASVQTCKDPKRPTRASLSAARLRRNTDWT
ncbi:MAG: hypothetical protein IPP88_18770 [Betaproteobacteria bacterium]|nr:hypothetical protein [Betaproteobacteria bacterium]